MTFKNMTKLRESKILFVEIDEKYMIVPVSISMCKLDNLIDFDISKLIDERFYLNLTHISFFTN